MIAILKPIWMAYNHTINLLIILNTSTCDTVEPHRGQVVKNERTHCGNHQTQPEPEHKQFMVLAASIANIL